MKSMGQTQEDYYRGVRMAPYDLIKELTVALAGVGLLTVVLAGFLSSPDVPPVTIASWSQTDPVDFVTTATGELAGTTGSAGYGQPYNSTPDVNQSWGPIAPQAWFGVRIPVDSANAFVIEPLKRASFRRHRARCGAEQVAERDRGPASQVARRLYDSVARRHPRRRQGCSRRRRLRTAAGDDVEPFGSGPIRRP